MTLYELLEKSEGEEFSVHDNDYDTLTYFYGFKGEEPNDDWDVAIRELSKLLTVLENDGSVTVNLSEVIEDRIDELDKADLFIGCNIDDIMADIDNILAGNVSESWMKKFVGVLKGDNDGCK